MTLPPETYIPALELTPPEKITFRWYIPLLLLLLIILIIFFFIFKRRKKKEEEEKVPSQV